jgi:hypothetical protein
VSTDVRAIPGEPRPRALAIGVLLLSAAALFWFGLGMHRGLLLSNDVKSMTWPWAPSYARPQIAAPALSDPVWQFVPWLTFARRELAAGRLPLWNPHQDGGVPLLGNAQSALGSPLVWPSLLLGVPSGWNLSLLLRLLLAFLGLLAWLRDAGRSVSAALLGGVAFALSGPFIAWLEHPHTAAAAPVPLLLLFVRRMAHQSSRGSAAGLAASTFLVLAGGHPETQGMAALLAAAYLAHLAPGWRRALRVVGCAALGAALAAPLLFPFFEYYWLSEARGGLDRRAFVLPLADLQRFLRPAREGSNVIEGAATVSITVLLLAAAAVARFRQRDTRFWLIVAACILAVAYDNPLARLLAEKTPIYWTRALLLIPIPLGYLAAETWDRVRAKVRLFRSRWGSALAFLPAVIASAELLAAARGVHGATPPGDLGRTPPILRRLAEDADAFRLLPLHTFLPANTATEYGLDDLRGYDALAPAAWRRRRSEIGRFINVPTQKGVIEPWDLAPGGRALDFWNVKYVLVPARFAFGAETLNARRGLDLVEVYSGPDGKLLRNRRVLPRARLEPEGKVEIVARSSSRWILELASEREAVLTVANPFFPGWRMWLDGQPARLTASPGDAMRLPVPPGRHRVEIAYEPVSFRLGLAAAASALFAALVFLRRLRYETAPAKGGPP